MKIGIAVDNTVPLHIPKFIEFIGAYSKTIQCHSMTPPRFSHSQIEYHREEKQLSYELRNEIIGDDISLLVTAIPFENNFFYIGKGNLYIISLSDWNLFTTLPMSNGIAYFLCQIIAGWYMDIGVTHDETTGCISDFLWDKKAIDIGMRAAFICEDCKTQSVGNQYLNSQEFADVIAILNAISSASRRGVDILLEPLPGPAGKTGAAKREEVFLCHNNADKAAVRQLNKTLQSGGINTWLDEERIMPADIWQDKLESAIPDIAACLVIVGDSGLGPWQDIERRAFINEFANKGCKIIPVLIGNPATTPELPLFLRQFMWSDLRTNDPGQVARLIAALRV
jgi:TIR domain